MKSIFLISLIAMVLLSPVSVLAQSDSFTQCVSNNTLNVFESDERCIDGKCDIYSTNKTINCTYGCEADLGICNPDPLSVNIIFGIIVILMIILVAWVVRRLTR